jgi:predicted enzyme related to lactoylglutathione lyase
VSDEIGGVGKIAWTDLTVPEANKVRDFYASVVGWTVSDVDMGGYSDYCMNQPANGVSSAGICWHRGINTGLPPVWLIYIQVANLEESVRKCEELGGRIVRAVSEMGEQGRYCVIQDPAGAVAALFQRPCRTSNPAGPA